jgi:hypothetical protein
MREMSTAKHFVTYIFLHLPDSPFFCGPDTVHCMYTLDLWGRGGNESFGSAKHEDKSRTKSYIDYDQIGFGHNKR